MKRLFVCFLLATPLLFAAPQASAPEGFEHWTTADLWRLGQAVNADAASDPHHIAVKQLADFPNEAFLLAHREADGQVEWHETQIDIFFVQSGSATLLVGGTYLNGETVAPHEKHSSETLRWRHRAHPRPRPTPTPPRRRARVHLLRCQGERLLAQTLARCVSDRMI